MTHGFSERLREGGSRGARVFYGAFLRLFRFDADFYRHTYGDVAHHSVLDSQSHWRTMGWHQGRFPSMAAVSFHAKLRGIDLTNADPLSYIVWNPELIAQGVTTREATLVRMASDKSWAKSPKTFSCPQQYLTALAMSEEDDSWSYGHSVLRETADVVNNSELETALQRPSAEAFVIETHRHVMGYPPGMKQLQEWVATLDAGVTWRPAVLSILVDLGPLTASTFSAQTTLTEVSDASVASDTSRARETVADSEYSLMGVPVMSRSELQARADVYSRDFPHSTLASTRGARRKPARRTMKEGEASPAVSVLVSLYRCEEFLPAWIENVLCLDDFEQCEFIMIVVDATTRERELLDSFAANRPRIRLAYLEGPFGIYAAWNTALAGASAPYVTNMNVDDLRSPNSVAMQRAVLDTYTWVDVVTNDVAIMLEPAESWDQIDAIGAVARFPLTTLPILQSGVNPPHNGPMWRRSLHDDLGLFDDSFTSSADWEFWLRCARAGKQFFAIPNPSVGYFDNPQGLSTSRLGASLRETRMILDANRDALVSGRAPAYVRQPRAFEQVTSRAHRLERGFVAEMTRLRREFGASRT